MLAHAFRSGTAQGRSMRLCLSVFDAEIASPNTPNANALGSSARCIEGLLIPLCKLTPGRPRDAQVTHRPFGH